MSDIKLGEQPNEFSERDAIHIAIAPIVAAENLRAGQHVGLLPDGTASITANKHIGIVDPFLNKTVLKGSYFWLLLYQNTITGMRHNWMHPDFTEDRQTKVSESELWLKSFAKKYWYEDYTGMMNEAKEGHLCFGDDDYPKDLSEEFWKHYNKVTGNTTDGYFRCAC